MTVEFLPATRAAAKARIALAGPSGSGKTYTALALATALGTTAVVDTERGSASKYAGINGWEFSTIAPQSFAPASLVEALAAASTAGFEVVVVDSLSHYWMGVDGMLEQVDRRAKNGNNFSGWKEAGPDERRMIDALVAYPGHVIVTLRVKTEYVVEQNERGKSAPRKVGLKPIQRDGIEYEFDVVGELDLDNTLTVTKSRIPTLSGAVVQRPGSELAETVRDWLADGEDAPGPREYQEQVELCTDKKELGELWHKVKRLGIGGAALQDADGYSMTLLQYIEKRAHSLGSPS
ncbi:ATP-binding protein [Amycolatopsis thailandensis]|uniref:ATP-binding protein n=1 Tax=Amycolatopsis thailandensis TaxID=589330 RepID=UPI0037B6E28E